MEKTQKDYYLNEQMRAIQTELGGKDEFKQELRDLDEKIEQQNFTPEARQKALAELKKLKSMSPLSAEAAVVRNYLDWLVSLPWGKINAENHDVAEAEGVLNAEHYGLKKVKERVLEYLAVISLVNKIKGPILCLVGPPGVGKTSLARSIAGATGRAFVKMSLGGVRDEAEIRGHRRTYIGAMPGKIIQNLKKAKCNNPLFLLDEIDKMSSDFRGDPASALLEVLDPEQNSIFHDHFLDVDYDLSAVMFITTANSLHTIPRPLLDRLEIIRLEGYSEHEKLNIAKRFLVAKQIDSHGLNDRKVAFTDHALLDIIRFYTRESGVRNLERCIAAICRKIAVIFIKNKKKRFLVHAKHLEGFLGRRKYQDRPLESADSVGVAIGLAWTESGGDLLGIEVAIVPGKGKLTITGKLGDVMQESAHAAMTYVRSRSQLLGLERNFYQNIDTHIHVPEGAIPKDGPSAGITMATALISALTKIPVRRDLAMTGEITLRGVILPIGGLKEKLMAAKRSGMHLVLVPAENEKDLAELDPEITGNLIINTVSHMDEVLSHALVENVELSAPRSILKNQDLIVDNAAIAH
jgi:ATP-dependent Lon protease